LLLYVMLTPWSPVARRESERRNHSLARHADILAAVETRLSLLNMTFMKYVDSNLCCFIPGKVSDATSLLTNRVNTSNVPPGFPSERFLKVPYVTEKRRNKHVYRNGHGVCQKYCFGFFYTTNSYTFEGQENHIMYKIDDYYCYITTNIL